MAGESSFPNMAGESTADVLEKTKMITQQSKEQLVDRIDVS